MDKPVICYFSATGNSLFIARTIAEAIEGELISLPAEETSLLSSIEAAKVIGFVFPLYDFKPPGFLLSFLERTGRLEGKYLFAVSTHGLAPGKSMEILAQKITARGGTLSLGASISMPHTGIGGALVSPEMREHRSMDWENRKESIISSILNRESHPVEKGRGFSELLKKEYRDVRGILFRFLKQVMLHGIHSLDHRSEDFCTGCGTCVRICPQNNITLKEGKARWGDNCLNCFACIHWCPESAATLGGVDMGIGQYHHPGIQLKDMIRS